jgi:predicted dehydrogenase
MKTKDNLRVIIIGAGGMGKTHIGAWKKIDHVEVAALCDIDAKRAADLAQANQVPQTLTDYRKAVKLPADVVDVCSPNNSHAPIVLAAFQAGKHVLCEKPLAVLPRHVEQMMAARDRAKKLLMTAQHMRFSGPARSAKRYIDQGSLGQIYYGRAWHLRRRALPNWGVFIQKRYSGGGACVDIGVHSLDLTMWLMDNFQPVGVSGIAPCILAKQQGIYNRWGAFDQKLMDVEDFAVGFVRFKNGAALSLEASWMLNIQPGSIVKTWLYGTKAGVEYPDLIVSTEHDQLQLDATIINAPQINGYEEEIRAFYESVTQRKESPVPAEQTLQVIKILDGIYRSHRSGKEVKL